MPVYARGGHGAIRLTDSSVEKGSEELPSPNTQKDHPVESRGARRRRLAFAALASISIASVYAAATGGGPFFPRPPAHREVAAHIKDGLAQCAALNMPAPDVATFSSGRKVSDRFEKGTRPVLLKNGTLWTAGKKGEEIIHGGSIWMEGGVQRKVGTEEDVRAAMVEAYVGDLKGHDVEEIDLEGKWVTPGIVDLHSHIGVDAAPSLQGASDTNSIKSPIMPYLRSLDGFNTHDLAQKLSMSGGVTSMLVLPGSANNIGGQAFMMKPRQTEMNTPSSMQVDPPFKIVHQNGTAQLVRTGYPRHSKHACGENISRVYKQTRMDTGQNFRHAYGEGKKLMDAQDRWCARGEDNTEPFPENDEWEMLADTIRGKVRVNIHCYETTDLDQIIRLSQQFKFRIAAIHHAHETYLVPDTLKNGWHADVDPPAIAIFATNARYKRESYRGSEYAPYILSEAGLPVVMKSDHPVLDSRFLVWEATQAHHYGLSAALALSSVTSTSAKAAGMDHRMGHLKDGYDADVVVWDSYPLTLGATPVQTYVDGIPQIDTPVVVAKGEDLQKVVPERDVKKEAALALKYRGDPPLSAPMQAKNVVFQGVTALYLRGDNSAKVEEMALAASTDGKLASVVIKDGEIKCAGHDCVAAQGLDFEIIDLKGGSLSTGLTTYGSQLGLLEIRGEASTADGKTFDGLAVQSPLVDGMVVKGSDGAVFNGKDQLIAYANGVTRGVAHPASSGLFSGLSYSFSTNGKTAIDGVHQDVAAMHVSLGQEVSMSTSTHIGVLRSLLLGETGEHTELTRVFKRIAKGEITLVVHVSKADIMSHLILLKREVGGSIKMTFEGAHEAWILADEIAEANIGVIISPPRSYPGSWDSRRIMAGPPITKQSLAAYLTDRGVTVGLGVNEEWMARNTRQEAAWIMTNSAGVVNKSAALDLVSTNLDKLLGLKSSSKGEASWVAYEGDMFTMDGRVKAVRAEGKAVVDLF